MRIFRFSNPLYLKVSGADSGRYLNARLSNDLSTASPEQFINAAALTPQGKTEALFTVLYDTDNQHELYCTGGDHKRIVEALFRFKVADRVEYTDNSEEIALAHLAAENIAELIDSQRLPLSLEPDAGVTTSRLDTGLRVVACRRLGSIGVDLLGTQQQIEELAKDIRSKPYTEEEFEFYRLKSGLPSFPQELNAETLFSESGRVDAISFSKGCYVGQEVTEKIDAIGKLPFRLQRFSAEGFSLPDNNTTIRNQSAEKVGQIVSCASLEHSNTTYGFARIKSSAIEDDGGFFANDFEIKIQEIE